MTTAPVATPPIGKDQYNNYPKYAPRIWHGMTVSSWASLLLEHNFGLDRYPMSAWITFFSVVNSASNRLQAIRFRKQAIATPLVKDPIFILGHWRTGTTMLHTLFQLDPNFWTPTTYECLAPGHFMVTESVFPNLMKFPSRRPMDNMSMGWDQPQEDEFVLCTRGLPSVYRNIAFPHDPLTSLESLTMKDVSAEDRQRWKDTLMEFVRYLNLARHRRLVMKSPTHTGRIELLLELFPNAKFVHLARDPQEFIPSTLHLWRALHATNGLVRDVNDLDREDYVFDCFARMYDGFEESRRLIPANNYTQLTYDELTVDTGSAMRGVYERLSLGDFSSIEQPLNSYVDSQRGYRRNQHDVPADLSERIRSMTTAYAEQFLTGDESVRAA